MRLRNLAASVLVVSSVLAQPSLAAPRPAPQTPEDALRQVIEYDRRGGGDEIFNRKKFTPAMRRLLSENLARDWVAAHATGENVFDADVFSGRQSTTASNKYSIIKKLNSNGRSAQLEATMYTTVDDFGYFHREIFIFLYEDGGWRLDDINYAPDAKVPKLLHDGVRTFIKPAASKPPQLALAVSTPVAVRRAGAQASADAAEPERSRVELQGSTTDTEKLRLSIATRTPAAQVTFSSGLGTSEAQATGIFTAKDKREQCEGYHTEENEIIDCVASWGKNLPKLVAASADCPAGVLFFSGGGRYEYAGEWDEKVGGRNLTKWKGANAEIVTVAMASEAYPLDQNWRLLCPGIKPRVVAAVNVKTIAASKPVDATTQVVSPTGRPWRHNGSIVMADPDTGIIAYIDPKASLRPVVQEGSVLFRGAIHPNRPVRGTAYAYKAGCSAAPYPVTGTYSGLDTLTLRGAGPVRRGCEVVGYSERSPHAVLRFSYLLDD